MKFLLTVLLCATLLYGEEEALSLDVEGVSSPSIEFSEVGETPFHFPRKSAALSAGLSIVPGLGHVYLGDYRTGATLMGTVALSGAAMQTDSDARYIGADLLIRTLMYSLYAGYRDGRKYNGFSGYSYEMPRDSLADLAWGCFKPSILKKKEVWGGLIGALVGAAVVQHYVFSKDSEARLTGKSFSWGYATPMIAFPVGISEEALFRGYLQSQFAEISNPFVGIGVSSLLFGIVHMPNAFATSSAYQRKYYSFVVPFITLMGGYFGWVTHKNHSLQESTAIHTWYDFTLFALRLVAMKASLVEDRASFMMTLPF